MVEIIPNHVESEICHLRQNSGYPRYKDDRNFHQAYSHYARCADGDIGVTEKSQYIWKAKNGSDSDEGPFSYGWLKPGRRKVPACRQSLLLLEHSQAANLP